MKSKRDLRSNPEIKAILFDHDDTLVQTIKSKWAQHKYIAKTFYHKNLKDEELRLHWGKPFTELVELLSLTVLQSGTIFPKRTKFFSLIKI